MGDEINKEATKENEKPKLSLYIGDKKTKLNAAFFITIDSYQFSWEVEFIKNITNKLIPGIGQIWPDDCKILSLEEVKEANRIIKENFDEQKFNKTNLYFGPLNFSLAWIPEIKIDSYFGIFIEEDGKHEMTLIASQNGWSIFSVREE